MKTGSNLNPAVEALDTALTAAIRTRAEMQMNIVKAMDEAAQVDKAITGLNRAISILNDASNKE